MDNLKSYIPFVTFIMGAFMAPYIEAWKDKAKAKKIYNNFIVELNDELEDLPVKLKTMSRSLVGLKAIKDGNPIKGQLGKYVPRKMMFYFTEDAIENSFCLLSKEQRYAIKSFLLQVDALNRYMSEIKEVPLSDETLEFFIDNCKRYLYTGASMLNTMRIITKNSHADKGSDDNKIITDILNELDIDLSIDDLIIKKSTTFKQS